MSIISGIHKIVNKINNHYYVGSSINILRRWRNHRVYLEKGKHNNDYLQNAWNKYEAVNFHFEIIEEVLNVKTRMDLHLHEQKYLDVALNEKDNNTLNEIFS